MTTFPTFLDHFATTVLGTPAQAENPHHRALLETYAEVQQLEHRLLTAMVAPHPQTGPDEKHACTEFLLDRLPAGQELAALMSVACCCAAEEEDACAKRCSPAGDPGEHAENDEAAAPWRDGLRH